MLFLGTVQQDLAEDCGRQQAVLCRDTYFWHIWGRLGCGIYRNIEEYRGTKIFLVTVVFWPLSVSVQRYFDLAGEFSR